MDIPFDDDHYNTGLGHAAYELKNTVETFLEGPANTVRHIKDENGRFGLGVVVSRPGDAIQNWHQDGDSLGEDAGKTYIAFMTASRVAGKNLGFSQDALPGPLQIIKDLCVVVGVDLPSCSASTNTPKISCDGHSYFARNPGCLVLVDRCTLFRR